jgi:hypothetical protein
MLLDSGSTPRVALFQERGVTSSQKFAILTMLGEANTTKRHRDRDSVGMPNSKKMPKTAARCSLAVKKSGKLKGGEGSQSEGLRR